MPMKLVGLVPCAGLGSRLRLPFSKEMFPDLRHGDYFPVVGNTVRLLQQAGVQEVIFTVNPRKTDLLTYLGNGRQFGMKFTYSIHPEPRSLAESLDEAFHLIGARHTVMVMPDTVITPPFTLQQGIRFHRRVKPTCTLLAFRTQTPWKFGMVDSVGDLAVNIIDKPKETHLEWMWGGMIWSPKFTRILHDYVQAVPTERVEFPLSDVLAKPVAEHEVRVFFAEEGTYVDIGTFDELVRWVRDAPGVS